MPIAIRIDVDNPFGYATTFKKILNRMSLDYNLVPRWERLGYLEQANRMREHIEDLGIPVTWFFRTITAPGKRNLQYFSAKSNEIDLHSERTETFHSFQREVAEWKMCFGRMPTGFSKHGSGDMKLSRKHAMEYEREKFIAFGKKMGLRYFIGNGVEFTSPWREEDGLVYVPAVVWLDNIALHGPEFQLEDVVAFSRNSRVVVLLHPMWWSTREDVRNRLVELAKACEIVSLAQILGLVRDSNRLD